MCTKKVNLLNSEIQPRYRANENFEVWEGWKKFEKKFHIPRALSTMVAS